MKIIACKNRFDDDMVELYNDHSTNYRYMLGAVHIDNFHDQDDTTVEEALQNLEDGEEIVLRVSVDIIPDD